MELVIIVWPVTIGYHCMVTISIGRFALNIYIYIYHCELVVFANALSCGFKNVITYGFKTFGFHLLLEG